MTNNTVFRVARGLDEKINQLPYEDGYVYFATDTKKIYLDANEQRTPMGGNTGIYYGKADFTGLEGPEFIFKFEELEGENLPNTNDLILNSDGSFYKVLEVYKDTFEIKTEKLTIAGSGGGGGDSPLYGKMNIQVLPISFHQSPYKTIIAGSECKIEFIYSAKDAENNRTGNGRYEVLIDGVLRKTGTAKQKANDEAEDIINIVDLTEYFKLVGSYTVQINCYGNIGGAGESSISKRLYITSTAFELKWPNGIKTEELETNLNYLNNDFKLNWVISGGLTDVITHIVIDDLHNFTTTGTSYTFTPEDLETIVNHGAHKIEIYATSFIGNEDVRTKSIIYNVLFVDRNDSSYIISCKFYQEQVKQYDTLQLPVMIYSPTNVTGEAEITFKVNSEEKSTIQKCENLKWYYFAFTPADGGFIPLEFVCDNSSLSLTLDVEEIELDISEVTDYVFKFKATDFSNDEEIKNWNYNGQKIIFSENFDWNNGGLKTGAEDAEQMGPYFKIPAGSRMTIPYNLFGNNTLASRGANFKMIFKAYNCQDYDAIIAENYEETPNKKIGLRLKAQGSLVTDGSTSSEVRYCEDSYIEYEYDYIYNSNERSEQYLITWIDGVPSRVTLTTSSSFTNSANNKQLVIGSDDCDVYVYLIKFYNRHLLNEEHLNNFIMDASNATQISQRYHRNNVYSVDTYQNKYIDYKKLVVENPNCNAYIFEIPKIPTSKDDVVENGNDKCCAFTHYLANNETPLHRYDGVKLRAQGTSSMAYGLSAYNLDAKFPEAWSMDEEAIPVNYMNIKVNVASCEEANNALNQEWYNRYQPYQSRKKLQVREDGKIARDTMEFKPGVLFLIDKNKKINESTYTDNNVFKEIDGYVETPYARLYSICNMGNSKKNTDVFHGAGNEFECCVENADNNTASQQMVTIGGYFEKTIGDREYEAEVNLNLSEDLFDENGYVRENVDWGVMDVYGKLKDPKDGESVEEVLLDSNVSKHTLWRNALTSLFEFRYVKEKDDIFDDDDNIINEALFDKYANRFLRLVHWFVKYNPSSTKTEQEILNLSDFEKEKYLLNGDGSDVILPAYSLRGVKKSGANSNYPEENEILAGYSLGEQKFKYDSSEYRAAKMFRECENYLIMDSIVFHYLFIERHTMADNVAKNTFWNTEDGIHWDLTKNYDNDTADGVDNNGELSFDYGYEILDKTSTGSPVFNASNSSWLNFIYYLPLGLREKMYSHNKMKDAWKAQTYLFLFKEEWQDFIPEACWIESFYRKYFRPYEIYNNKDYLSRLAGGKKTHQRKQYETYQEQYISSKYEEISSSSNIQWRSTGTETSDTDELIYFNATLYADGYVTGAIASGQDPNIHIRAKKGENVTISYLLQKGTSLTDATGYLYFPNLFTKLENVEMIKPQRLDVSQANKLKLLSLDASKNNTQNNLLTQSTSTQETRLALNNNIQNIIIKNCEKVLFGLDLQNCNRLISVNLDGSTFTSLAISNSPVNKIIVENPSLLTLNNLYYLTNDNFVINDYSRLIQLNINNIDFNINSSITKNLSKNILKNIFNYAKSQNDNSVPTNYLTYQLNNVGWEFDSDDIITDTNIEILDNLLKQNYPNTIDSHSLALTGFGIVPEIAYNKDNYLALYEKYGLISVDDNSYPYFILDFQDSNNESKLYTIDIKDGNGKIVWSRQIKDYASVTNELLENSSLGAFDAATAIQKRPDNMHIYTFADKWKYTFSTGYSNIISNSNSSYLFLDLAQLPDNINANVIIEPYYNEEERLYTVEFKYNELSEPFYKISTLKYGDSFELARPKEAPYKDDSLLSFELTYKLKGYTSLASSTSVINEERWKVTDNTTLYPVFEQANVYDIDYSEYLDIVDNTTTINGMQATYKELKGLKLADNGNYMYQGQKITLPANINIIGANAFYNKTNIKYIFVAKNSSLLKINGNAFRGDSSYSRSKVEFFDFKNCKKLYELAEQVFFNGGLKPSLYGENGIINLPDSLINIGRSCFNNCFIAENHIVNFYIPSSVKNMKQYAIAHFENTVRSNVYIGAEGDFSNLIINSSEKPLISSNASDNNTKDIGTVTIYTNKYAETDLVNHFIGQIIKISVVTS